MLCVCIQKKKKIHRYHNCRIIPGCVVFSIYVCVWENDDDLNLYYNFIEFHFKNHIKFRLFDKEPIHAPIICSPLFCGILKLI